jgi:hypothetical protein
LAKAVRHITNGVIIVPIKEWRRIRFCFPQKYADLCTIRFLNRVRFVFAIIHAATTAALAETTQFVRRIIELYYRQRPHQSIGYMPPQMVHNNRKKNRKKMEKLLLKNKKTTIRMRFA